MLRPFGGRGPIVNEIDVRLPSDEVLWKIMQKHWPRPSMQEPKEPEVKIWNHKGERIK
jgi:hypothetical protein